ncbi:MAG: galactose-1-phosphate uridylyltransferase [Thermoleophilia bacterium]|nr:galactose-1-phosphate uridylyltransferase [Thermoleophilia bacterium]
MFDTPPTPGAEWRRDPLTHEWRAIVGSRQTRPNLPTSGCPFCVGGLEAPDDYVVRAFANRWPSLVPGEPVALDAAGLPTAARGDCEVVLYAPDHDATLASIGAEGVRRVIDLWAERTTALLARDEVEYVLIFENRGAEVGATQHHPHGQIYAFGQVPPLPAREFAVAAAHGCALCRDAADLGVGGSAHGSPDPYAVTRVGSWSARVPAAMSYPHEVLLTSDRHAAHLADLSGAERDELAAVLVDVLERGDRRFGAPLPYMLWVHPGDHLHLHVVSPFRAAGVQRFIAAGEVGSGTFFNPVAPEALAAELRAL